MVIGLVTLLLIVAFIVTIVAAVRPGVPTWIPLLLVIIAELLAHGGAALR